MPWFRVDEKIITHRLLYVEADDIKEANARAKSATNWIEQVINQSGSIIRMDDPLEEDIHAYATSG